MAWLERDRPNGPFQIVFRYGKQRIKRSARTKDEQEATQLAVRVDRKLRLIEQGDLALPDNADVVTFLLSDGKLTSPLQPQRMMTLTRMFADFFDSLPAGAMEENSRRTVQTHRKHLEGILGANLPIRDVSPECLQRYINQRAKQPGRRGKTVSPVTIRKELSTLSSVWSFGLLRGYVLVPFPSKGLRFPKTAEKPSFQTRTEIEQQIAMGGLSVQEQAELWDALYLTLPEIDSFLTLVRRLARHPFLYPMIVAAADTGARRSELLRSEKRDFDLRNNMVTLREKKKSRGRFTTRRVPLSDRLRAAIYSWFRLHPGGRFTFCLVTNKSDHRTRALSVNQADDHFGRTLACHDWSKVRGWHVLRHSFASNCASKGIDQRIINAWMGHQTEEMVRRYQHLVPDAQQSAMQLLAVGE